MNFKRKKPKHRTYQKMRHMWSWPAWWDVVFYRRPKRRAAHKCEREIKKGADADAMAWPVSSNKPHVYYW